MYKMTIDLTVLDHLGINLYSNISAVMTEVVANAWDADANNVSIKFTNHSQSGGSIEITDDGIGMTIQDMNEKYLKVGYRRRELDTVTGKVTASGRSV
ncbi:MAG TPA: ATP-binding protein, partial [Candidatus Didemnitutus sp.]|nr:ATP-binding protein [Candidatus Didemnitutus sp.]